MNMHWKLLEAVLELLCPFTFKLCYHQFLFILFSKILLISFLVYGCFVYRHGYAPWTCSAYRGQKRVLFPWNWSYRWLWAAVWVLGTEPEYTGRTASALNSWAFCRSSMCSELHLFSPTISFKAPFSLTSFWKLNDFTILLMWGRQKKRLNFF